MFFRCSSFSRIYLIKFFHRYSKHECVTVENCEHIKIKNFPSALSVPNEEIQDCREEILETKVNVEKVEENLKIETVKVQEAQATLKRLKFDMKTLEKKMEQYQVNAR